MLAIDLKWSMGWVDARLIVGFWTRQEPEELWNHFLRHITTAYTFTDRFAIILGGRVWLGWLVADRYTCRFSQSTTKAIHFMFAYVLYFFKDKWMLSIAKSINQEYEIPL